jgi:hypothetical protein
MAFQQEPRQTLWSTRKDGSLLSFTYDVEQDVYGWHRHPLGGNAFAECVCSIPSPDGQSDDLWLIATQTVNGKAFRYVELLTSGYHDGDNIGDAVYLDTAMIWEGSIAQTGVDQFTFPILTQWIGAQVFMVVDGVPVGYQTVINAGGFLVEVLGPVFGNRIVIGFPYRGLLETMRSDDGAADGTAQGKTKRTHELWIRLRNTCAAKVGPDVDTLETLQFRTPADPMSTAVAPFTGDMRVPWPGTFETEGRVCVVQDEPLPMTVVALMPRMATND